jgi:hypothetical protein
MTPSLAERLARGTTESGSHVGDEPDLAVPSDAFVQPLGDDIVRFGLNPSLRLACWEWTS